MTTEVKKESVPHVWVRAGVNAAGAVRKKCEVCRVLQTQPEAAQSCADVQKWQRRYYPGRRSEA